MAFVGDALLASWDWREDLVPLANPLSADLAVMRPSLLPGLVEALRRNRARQQDRVRLFEIGHAFRAGADAPAGNRPAGPGGLRLGACRAVGPGVPRRSISTTSRATSSRSWR